MMNRELILHSTCKDHSSRPTYYPILQLPLQTWEAHHNILWIHCQLIIQKIFCHEYLTRTYLFIHHLSKSNSSYLENNIHAWKKALPKLAETLIESTRNALQITMLILHPLYTKVTDLENRTKISEKVMNFSRLKIYPPRNRPLSIRSV